MTLIRSSASYFFAADVPKICRSNVFKSHRYAPTAYCDADSISITGTGSPIMHFDKGCPFHCGAPSSAVQSISDDDPNRICYRHRLTGSSISLIGAFAGPLDADKRSRIPLDFFFTTHPVFIYGLAVKTLPSSSSSPP